MWGLFFLLFCLIAAAHEPRPDFSGAWLLDAVTTGSEPEIWLQRRPLRLMIQQSAEELTIDTGDGSLFGVSSAVTEVPLRYRFDGSIVTVLDHSQGDIQNFTRKINTEAFWKSDSRLFTFTTHFPETASRAVPGTTRIWIFSITGDHELKLERTGYRGARPDPSAFFGPLPKYLHNGRIEDDRAYAKDIAFYKKVIP